MEIFKVTELRGHLWNTYRNLRIRKAHQYSLKQWESSEKRPKIQPLENNHILQCTQSKRNQWKLERGQSRIKDIVTSENRHQGSGPRAQKFLSKIPVHCQITFLGNISSEVKALRSSLLLKQYGLTIQERGGKHTPFSRSFFFLTLWCVFWYMVSTEARGLAIMRRIDG